MSLSSMNEIVKASEYVRLLDDIKHSIQSYRTKAALAVSRELVFLNWEIAKQIVTVQEREGWGKSVVEQLSNDLKEAFPENKGFSTRSLWRMRSFYLYYNEIDVNLPQLVAEIKNAGLTLPITDFSESDILDLLSQIPWGHNGLLIERIKQPLLSLWYAGQVIENGWSRNMLDLHIDNGLHLRDGKATTNFELTLPKPDSDLAQQVLKDPYNFDFLTLTKRHDERQIENELIANLERFLLELGMGFSFVGRQYKLEVEGDEYYLDLLFYHLKLRCFVVIELKAQEFKPEHVGKMQFYTSAVDDLLRHENDKATIGLILCKKHKKTKVAYALKDTNKPIGVASFTSKGDLPKELQGSLPDPEQLEWVIERLDQAPD